MNLKNEFLRMVTRLSTSSTFPPIAGVFLPPYQKGGQRKDAQFMAIVLEGGACGISYLLLPEEKAETYKALEPRLFVGRDPEELALEFGSVDPLEESISMAAINAICQHVMNESHYVLDKVTDSLGLLSIRRGDRIGMVGLFSRLIEAIEKAGAELVIIERKDALIQKYRDLPITADVAQLATCNKILCTSTTVLNNSLDEVLAHCSPDAFVSVVGPSAGYFPDPLFARGVDVVGGRVVENSEAFLQRLSRRQRWGDTTSRTCFQKDTYSGILDPE
jgi:uncharacterized protein (DUF4213/DUF364 family)